MARREFADRARNLLPISHVLAIRQRSASGAEQVNQSNDLPARRRVGNPVEGTDEVAGFGTTGEN